MNNRKGVGRARNTAQNLELDRKCRDLDKLAEFEKFKTEILPALQKDLKSGMSPKEMRKKWLSHLTARQISIAMAERDSGKALAAIKDIQDREEGKAIETKRVTHRYEEMSDQELDALIATKAAEIDDSALN